MATPFRTLTLRLGVVFVLLASPRITPGQGVEGLDFERDVAPILTRRCLECHHQQQQAGGLNLTTRAGVLAGGESGTVVQLGDASHSLLWQRVRDGEMPPPQQGHSRQLPEQEVQQLKAWIDGGLPFPADRQLDLFEKTTDARGGRDWWSLQPIQRPPLPVTPTHLAHRTHNAIDSFVLHTLTNHDMTLAPPADRRILVRRAYVDLWGLPPTADQVAEFLADPRVDAYERLLDQLLASPRYGERWARHWLDVVRFAETCGYERDQIKPNIWKYRDWVIQAFNQDMPYDRFVLEQLAGDELSNRSESSVIATGMLRAGTWNDEPNDPEDYLYERLEDMVHVTSSAFLGLTVKCARCHDHKFDPIPQVDYYRIASYFWAGYLGQANLGGPSREELGFDVFGWTDRSRDPPPIRLLIKGERHQPGPEVPPGFLSAVSNVKRTLAPPAEASATAQRRLQFAQWLTDRHHPLTARVMVNRLWHHHFGAGLVRSTNNFGFKGDVPTHPHLLDWLATEFIEGEWQLKRIHKLIMMSATYQQSCDHPEGITYASRDSGNQYLWHMSRRRLDAESLRDGLLLGSGSLNDSMGGPSFFPHMSSEALEGLSRKDAAWSESSADQRARRSIYMMTMRSRILPLMTTFDFCDTTLPCGQRDVTLVPTQALALLNNDFIHDCSQTLAQRILQAGTVTPDAQIDAAFRAILARQPRESERESCRTHLATQATAFTAALLPSETEMAPSIKALASLCHVLMNSNEFVFVE